MDFFWMEIYKGVQKAWNKKLTGGMFVFLSWIVHKHLYLYSIYLYAHLSR